MTKTAFLFPGQGSQYVGMGRGLHDAFPEFRQVFREASEALGMDLAALCFEGPEERLTLTEWAQPAILAVSVAVARILAAAGLYPDFVAGHSLGEYSAVVCAGGLTPAEGARLVHLRGKMMSMAMPAGAGGMVAVLGLDPPEIESVCREAGGSAEAANYNCPGQVVVSGLKEDLEKVAELARKRGARRIVPLAVSGPFHSRFMEPVAGKLGGELKKAGVRDLGVPLVSNVDAHPHRAASEITALLTRQIAAPVRWEESMRFLSGRGVKVAVEAGPGKVLAGLMKRIDPDVRVFTTDGPDDIKNLREFLAEERLHD